MARVSLEIGEVLELVERVGVNSIALLSPQLDSWPTYGPRRGPTSTLTGRPSTDDLG